MMKKITLLLFSTLFFGYFSFAQSQRMVLAEELTSATCPPCASQNPAFNALLDANPDIVTSIKYQMNWPTAGGDPMYLHNPADNGARRNYYGVNSIPHLQLDGGFSEQPQYANQTTLNNAASIPSPFNIQVQHTISPNGDSIYLTTLIEVTEDVGGNLFAHNVVIEKEIHFSSPPGTTNEKDFYNVMKKMLPSAGGTSLPSSMSVGDYVILQNSWALKNVYDNDELGVVSFVQDNIGKDVHQAANSSTSPIIPVYNVDAEINSVTYATSTNCSGLVTPSITIRNNGAENLTSMTINYSINGGDEMVYEWSGDLDFLESETIDLSEMSFPVSDTNHLIIIGTNTNGIDDEYAKNNIFDFEILNAPVLIGNSIVFLILDENPEETTWEIKNSSGEIVQSGGPYTTSGQKFEPITVSASDCYEFVIYDTGGDGTEYYAVVYGNNLIAFEGHNFGDLERNEFAYGTVGIEPALNFNDLQVYPNPATDKINVEFYLTEPSDLSISVIDIVGKVVLEIAPGQASTGPQQFSIDAGKLNKGVYMLQIKAGNTRHIEKISVH